VDLRKVEAIYETLSGLRLPEAEVPGIEDAYAEGSVCWRNYAEVLDAYQRLCVRLHTDEEDTDVETIINNMFTIEKELCIKMFYYGLEYGRKEKTP